MSWTNLSKKSVKAFVEYVRENNKEEYLLACCKNTEVYNIPTAEEIKAKYPRVKKWEAEKNGASKCAYILNNIVIKRYLIDGYIDEHQYDDSELTGNQIVDEIKCFLEFQNRPEADLICPILRYHMGRGKTNHTSEYGLDEAIVICQRAIEVDDARTCCKIAEARNKNEGFKGESASDRYNKLVEFSKKQGWRDAIYNSGNSGVIFDYNANCYKAVFIDYAL